MKPEDRVPTWKRHPITELTHEKRLKVISDALKEVAKELAQAAEDREWLEETEGLWSDKFFRTLVCDPEGVSVEYTIHFLPFRSSRFGEPRESLIGRTRIDREDLEGLTLPVEAEIILGIPSED